MNELGKKGKRDVRFWKYDDGSFGLIVVERQYQDELLQQNPQQERLPQDDSSQQNPQQRIKKQYVDCGVYRTKTKLNKKIDGKRLTKQRTCQTRSPSERIIPCNGRVILRAVSKIHGHSEKIH